MDILYLIHYAGRAGTEKYVRELMGLYTRQGHRCHLCYCVPAGLEEDAQAAGWPVLRLDMQPRHTLRAARRLARYCRDWNIRVVHAQYPRENVIAVLASRFCPGLRVVFTSHLTIRQGLLWRLVNRLVTPGDAWVVSVCSQGAALLRENGVDPRRIRVVYNGLIPRPLPPRQNAVREEFGLGPDCFVMLTMARYAPEKGLPFLLEALALVKERAERPFACLIAGDGEGFSALGEEIRRLGLERHVIQAGFRRDTQRLLCSSDLYVSSALYNEAMSFAILEAMECALPVVVTDVGAGRDLAETGTRCGTAVPPGDRQALAEGILELMEDDGLRLRLGRAAREKAVREFDLRVQAQKLLALYGASGQTEARPGLSSEEEPGPDCKTGVERKP